MNIELFIGGVIGIGFDELEKYMLVISHSGRGLYEVKSWILVARDAFPVYPELGQIAGIGPISGKTIMVKEKDYDKDSLEGLSPRKSFRFSYEDGLLSVCDQA